MRHEKESKRHDRGREEHKMHGRGHAEHAEREHEKHGHHSSHMKHPSHHKVETHLDGHKFEYHHDNDMHEDSYEMAHGHRNSPFTEMHADGGLPREEMYYGITGGDMNARRGMGEMEKERKMEGGGRMARQHKQRLGTGMRDDTVYGRLPPIPGRIDS